MPGSDATDAKRRGGPSAAAPSSALTSTPPAVYFRSASSESSGPSSRWKAPRSIRTSLVVGPAAETEAIVGAPVFSESSPK